MKIGAIVQARTSSTRLPGKILKDLPEASGISVLEHVIRRLKRSRKISDIIIATTLEKEDDRIIQVAKRENARYFRGDKENVLSRHFLAARENNLSVVVRVTSDCPCIDPEIVDLVIDRHINSKADYTSNNLEKTFPHGLDTEVFNYATLKEAHRNARDPYDREHVTAYIRKSPDKFRLEQVKAPTELHAPQIRITLDTQADYDLLCGVFDKLYRGNHFFNAYDIVNFFKKAV